jgi:hypothetical protein
LVKVKVKLSLYRPDRLPGFQEVEAPRIDNRHMKVVRVSFLLTSRLYLPEKIFFPHFC